MYNPVRRNRNIGTANNGFKRQSLFREAPFQEKDFNNCEKIYKIIHNIKMTFYIDETSKGYIHACSIDDLIDILNQLPPDNIEGIEHIKLNQSTKKEELFGAKWGSLRYYGAPGFMPLITIEAQPCPLILKIKNSLNPFWQKETDFLKTQCKDWKSNKREHILKFDQKEIRQVQLYRTLPHEIGHWVDYKLGLDNLPPRQKEERANKYAALAKVV